MVSIGESFLYLIEVKLHFVISIGICLSCRL